MNYPLDESLVQQAITTALRSDGLTGGRCPGFEALKSTRPGASRVGDRVPTSFVVDALQAAAAESIEDLLEDDVVRQFVTATSLKVLSIATEVERYYFGHWDYDEMARTLGTPRAVLWPWWREAARTKPALSVPCLGTHAVSGDELLWIVSGSCRFVANDKISVSMDGSSSTVQLPIDVWQIDRGDARYVRVVLADSTII